MLAAGSVRLITSNLFVLTNLRASDSVGDPNGQAHPVVNALTFLEHGVKTSRPTLSLT